MTIKAYNSVIEMTGTGEEWLINASGEVLLVLVDGNIKTEFQSVGNTEITKVTL